jgi:hypothetical protein
VTAAVGVFDQDGVAGAGRYDLAVPEYVVGDAGDRQDQLDFGRVVEIPVIGHQVPGEAGVARLQCDGRRSAVLAGREGEFELVGVGGSVGAGIDTPGRHYPGEVADGGSKTP